MSRCYRVWPPQATAKRGYQGFGFGQLGWRRGQAGAHFRRSWVAHRQITTANYWSLRDLYRTLEIPGTNRLRDAHGALDSSFRAACGMKDGEEIWRHAPSPAPFCHDSS
jgi:hypothetical protein